ncbi:hypothetical protein ZZ1p0126 [Acinetobacter phage ZZ1]|jgi:hypothetical protein|uniref:Uncharacterized protein n=3 Tax=Caudoviricetes TaxID=2731619 RepID=A0A410T5G9_9CAUD|nr:hypothetical protein ZZ1p0126 [Acinetobacter phage ZZ1]AFL47458.1 hypothetical protein ZZ1p0126 [Acinetobacter phage ZZ1]QAU03978.1 hypothetical protein Henu6_gp175 [Acinetobacter phage Henu6]
MSLVGKYIIVKYDTEVIIDHTFKVIADEGAMVMVETSSKVPRRYMKHTILQVFDAPEDAEPLLALHKRYMKWHKKMIKKNRRMRKAILSLAQDFYK